MTENEIAREVVDCCYRVHTALGPGLLESVYESALAYELSLRGLRVARQVGVPVVYRGVLIDLAFKADLDVEEKVVVEVKSVESIAVVHRKQLLTYLRLMDRRLGLLVNFNVALIRDGISRVANGMEPE